MLYLIFFSFQDIIYFFKTNFNWFGEKVCFNLFSAVWFIIFLILFSFSSNFEFSSSFFFINTIKSMFAPTYANSIIKIKDIIPYKHIYITDRFFSINCSCWWWFLKHIIKWYLHFSVLHVTQLLGTKQIISSQI